MDCRCERVAFAHAPSSDAQLRALIVTVEKLASSSCAFGDVGDPGELPMGVLRRFVFAGWGCLGVPQRVQRDVMRERGNDFSALVALAVDVAQVVAAWNGVPLQGAVAHLVARTQSGSPSC
jgi:hypothetical protein